MNLSCTFGGVEAKTPVSHFSVKNDLNYIFHKYFEDELFPLKFNISKRTIIYIQNKVTSLFGYKICSQTMKINLENKANKLTRIDIKSVSIFNELKRHLQNEKIILPGYSFFQRLIGKAILVEKERLKSYIKENISTEVKAQLNMLLQNENNLYELTILKKEPKDFSYGEISNEIQKCNTIESLFLFSVTFLNKIDISNDSIRYYASLIDFYDLFNLNRLNENITYVYILCYINHRYKRMKNNLINAFISNVNKIESKAKSFAKDLVYSYKLEANNQLEKVSEILDLLVTDEVSDIRESAYNILSKNKISFMSKYISNQSFDELEFIWNYYSDNHLKVIKKLRPIFKNIDLKSNQENDPLIEAISFLKRTFKKGRSLSTLNNDEYPKSFIPINIKKYIYQSLESDNLNLIDGYKFEFLVYILLVKLLDSGDIYSNNSIRFCSFERDLIEDEKWEENKDKIIKEINLFVLNTPIEDQLDQLKNELSDKYKAVNDRIQNKENKYIKIEKKVNHIKWSLPYKKGDELIDNPVYKQLNQISIIDLILFVNKKTSFIKKFEHTLDQYTKKNINTNEICACILALGTNIGLSTMSDISDLNFNTLYNTANKFIRLETLKNANDAISNMTAMLPIFKYYNISENLIHSSSDGQRFESQVDTINSRYSSKYPGAKKGISAVSLVANHIPINSEIIGANDHESHFLFDILYNNTSDIKPDIHSTDSHGVNNVNFWILHAFGYKFAPRYKNIRGKTETSLYAFDSLEKYKDFIIKPIKKINESIIISEWKNIEKILASLSLKVTSQNIIIRKLSSYERKNRTKKALWELDNIIRSFYILDYIDDIELRRDVQRSLNRGEAYHSLRRAISDANLGKLKSKTEKEQQIWNESSRLIANCIIFYNANLLSEILKTKEKEKDFDAIKLIKKISPAAWRHINLRGKFNFKGKINNVDIMKIINSLKFN